MYRKDTKAAVRIQRRGRARREREERADIVIDLHDVHWPVIRRVAAPLAARGSWYLTETRAFFACRAATWDAKFGDDLPAYCAAVAEAGIRRGGVVIDVGCGTGRALPPLREAVGPAGAVIALDVTPEMLDAARPGGQPRRGRRSSSADARALPFADASADAIFAAGLVNHLPDTEAGLRELARVTRPGGLLVLFHPSGRAALAARHGHALSAGRAARSGGPLRRSTAAPAGADRLRRRAAPLLRGSRTPHSRRRWIVGRTPGCAQRSTIFASNTQAGRRGGGLPGLVRRGGVGSSRARDECHSQWSSSLDCNDPLVDAGAVEIGAADDADTVGPEEVRAGGRAITDAASTLIPVAMAVKTNCV